KSRDSSVSARGTTGFLEMWNIFLFLIFHKVAQTGKRPTTDFGVRTTRAQNPISAHFRTFPRLFPRLTHSCRPIGKTHERKDRRSRRTFEAKQTVACCWEKAGRDERLFRFAAPWTRALFASCACARRSVGSWLERRWLGPQVEGEGSSDYR